MVKAADIVMRDNLSDISAITELPELSSDLTIQSNPMSITEAGQGLYFRLFLKI